MATSTAHATLHSCFRDAFCARYRCRPDKFEPKVFWRTLSRYALLPTLLSGGLDRDFFQKDLETIRALGEVATAEDLDRVLDEFSSMNAVDRSFGRRFFRMRLSGTRIAELFRIIAPSITPVAVEHIEAKVRLDAATVAVNPGSSDNGQGSPRDSILGDANVVLLRKLRKVHEEITAGRPLESALSAIQTNPVAFEEALRRLGPGRPDLAWMRDYLGERKELAELRRENARLKGAVAELAIGKQS